MGLYLLLIKSGCFFVLIFSNIFSVHHPSQDSSYMYVKLLVQLVCLMLLCWWGFFPSFFSYFSLCFILDSWYFCVFMSTDISLVVSKSAVNPISCVFISDTVFLIPVVPLRSFYILHFILYYVHVLFYW